MTSTIETALTELSANLRRMEQRHQATGYKFDRLYGLIDAAREELASLTAATPPQDAESDYQRGYRHGYNRRDAEVQGALL